jgi:hypothetical protein
LLGPWKSDSIAFWVAAAFGNAAHGLCAGKSRTLNGAIAGWRPLVLTLPRESGSGSAAVDGWIAG